MVITKLLKPALLASALGLMPLGLMHCRYLDPKPQASTADALPPLPTANEGYALNPAPVAPRPAEPPPASEVPGPAPSEAAIQATGEPGRGRLPKAAVEATVSANMAAIESCYTRALRQKPGLQGQVHVSFVVAPDGSVPYAAALAEGTDLPSQPAIDCILAAFRQLHFDAPEGGRALVNYPLRFAPAP